MFNPTAASRVFGIQELFEKILVDVDPRTLLLAQRVNRRWKETIETNNALQIKLFFRPATNDEAEVLCLEPNSMVIDTDNFVVVNPLLLTQCYGSFIMFNLRKGVVRSLRADRPNIHSWWRMLLSQPPSSSFTMASEVSHRRHEKEIIQNLMVAKSNKLTSDFAWKVWNPDAPARTTIGERVTRANESADSLDMDLIWRDTQIRHIGWGSPVTGATMIRQLDELKCGRDIRDIRAHRVWMDSGDGPYGDVLPHGQMVDVECGHHKLVAWLWCCRDTMLRQLEAEEKARDATDRFEEVGTAGPVDGQAFTAAVAWRVRKARAKQRAGGFNGSGKGSTRSQSNASDRYGTWEI